MNENMKKKKKVKMIFKKNENQHTKIYRSLLNVPKVIFFGI